MRSFLKTPHARGAGLAVLVFLAAFGAMVPFCGYYLDDFGLVIELQNASPENIRDYFLHYVPGKNLHIPFLFAVLKLTGGSAAGIHLLGLALDALNVAAAYSLAYALTGLASLALPAAIFFALMTHHGETHFWAYTIPANLVSTSFLLASFLLALRGGGTLRRRLASSLAAYTVCFFTYDQVSLMWPLLIAAAYFRGAKPTRKPLAAALASLYCVSLNLAHLALRYLSTSAAGGRPLIHPGQIPRRLYDVLRCAFAGTFQQPIWGALPHWSLIVLLALGALTLGAYVARRISLSAEKEAAARKDFFASMDWRWTAAFGAAWFFLAYAPNLLNFISPRHGYLPSFGWALFWSALLGRAYRRWKRARTVILCGGILLFANAFVGNVHEGSEWVLSASHHRRFLDEAGRLAAPVENVFLTGAPRRFRRAPGFSLMHDVMLSARWGLRQPVTQGDNHIVPAGRGAFYRADLSSWPRDDFRWLPYDGMNLVRYTADDGYACASTVRLNLPDGTKRTRALRAGGRCPAAAGFPQWVALESSFALPPLPGEEARPLAQWEGLRLDDAVIASKDGLLRATLTWVRTAPLEGFIAFLPTLLDAGGATAYEPVYRIEALDADVIWPFAGDLNPIGSWKDGDRYREIHIARALRPIPPGEYRARLDVYSVREGERPVKLGTAEFPTTVGSIGERP